MNSVAFTITGERVASKDGPSNESEGKFVRVCQGFSPCTDRMFTGRSTHCALESIGREKVMKTDGKHLIQFSVSVSDDSYRRSRYCVSRKTTLVSFRVEHYRSSTSSRFNHKEMNRRSNKLTRCLRDETTADLDRAMLIDGSDRIVVVSRSQQSDDNDSSFRRSREKRNVLRAKEK